MTFAQCASLIGLKCLNSAVSRWALEKLNKIGGDVIGRSKKTRKQRQQNTINRCVSNKTYRPRSENNHGRHIEGSFQTEVLKTGHFKRPFGMKDFEGYNWWHFGLPWSFARWRRLRVGTGWWRRRALQETVVWSPTPFNPSKLSLRRVNPLKGLGHRDEPFRMERREY